MQKGMWAAGNLLYSRHGLCRGLTSWFLVQQAKQPTWDRRQKISMSPLLWRQERESSGWWQQLLLCCWDWCIWCLPNWKLCTSYEWQSSDSLRMLFTKQLIYIHPDWLICVTGTWQLTCWSYNNRNGCAWGDCAGYIVFIDASHASDIARASQMAASVCVPCFSPEDIPHALRAPDSVSLPNHHVGFAERWCNTLRHGAWTPSDSCYNRRLHLLLNQSFSFSIAWKLRSFLRRMWFCLHCVHLPQ